MDDLLETIMADLEELFDVSAMEGAWNTYDLLSMKQEKYETYMAISKESE